VGQPSGAVHVSRIGGSSGPVGGATVALGASSSPLAGAALAAVSSAKIGIQAAGTTAFVSPKKPGGVFGRARLLRPG
jgi:hypothetical protein